ncbi:AfsR/SARP family transcriptional regulator [Kutzneria sp. CA-103260]|uniref:AfsR/SARP family transcriptional regulator n=1 Tax=Kutzneria sp. CA-103260 TaxID=2802641 RepID=UPI001BA717B3|nr:AfsR/SARP family transcriptional regulator [Kutzneria sp. CA-103260]QUQ62334.1 SARP family transcriptional regulator [Kutzneria sp. CA-103260]
MTVRFALLGGVEAHVDGQSADIGHARQRCVLAALLVDANAVVPTGQLVDRVWGDDAPQRATGTLHSYLTRLRRVEGVTIVRRSGGYSLLVEDPLTIDVHEFRDLVGRARDAEDPALYEQALGLWRGEALAGLESVWAGQERARLGRERLAVELDHTDLRLRLGQHAALVPELLARAGEHPLDERAAGQLMLALYRTGRQAEALTRYEDVRRRLAADLGADPGPELRELHQRILTADPALTTRRPVVVPRQLPAPPAWFAGRTAELEALSQALAVGDTVPVATVWGNGGIGKTALALRWAHRHLDEFPDGQLHVNLRGFDATADPVPPSVALRAFLEALGVAGGDVPTDLDGQAALYRSLLADRRMLVVLDNAADSAQVGPLLPGSPTCAVIVTSRDRLAGLVSNHGARPLSVGLLGDRIGAALVAAEPEAVSELLACCAGFPLALSLVAGRAQTRPGFPLAALAAELRDATTRLGVLDEDDPGAGVSAVLSCSHRALPAEQARVFALLGLSPGPDISLGAAAAITGLPPARIAPVLRGLERLSLLQQDVPGRWRMHDLVRLFAVSRVVDAREPALRRLVAFYIHSGAAADRALDVFSQAVEYVPLPPDCQPDEPADGMGWFDSERACLLAVQRLAVELRWHTEVWQLAWVTVVYCYRRGLHLDNLAFWEASLLTLSHVDSETAAIIHRMAGRAYSRVQRFPESLDHLQNALGLIDPDRDPVNLCRTEQAIALVYKRLHEWQPALDHQLAALDAARRTGEPIWVGEALNLVATFAARLGRHDWARTRCAEALAIFRQHKDIENEADATDVLGVIAAMTGDHATAVGHHQRALDLYRQSGNNTVIGATLADLGRAQLALGQLDAARDAFQQAIAVYDRQSRDAEADAVRQELANLLVPSQRR